MSKKKQQHLPSLPGGQEDVKYTLVDEVVDWRADQRPLNAGDEARINLGANTFDEVGKSHPGLLALARVLGRHAARAELRRVRRGATPVMVATDRLLLVAALIVGAIVWGIVAGIR